MSARKASSQAAARLRTWLLRGPVQLAQGEHAGGIVGSFASDGTPAYVYGEITGYYLHWLAGAGRDKRVSANAAAACAWSARWFGRDLPVPTRIHLAPAAPDWRNDAVFLFDLAMLARGIAAATRAALCEPTAALSQSLGREVSRFHSGDALLPLRRVREGAELPDRWSTRDDDFLLKAATRVLDSAPPLHVDPAMLEACRAFADERAPGAADAGIGMLHPTLYYLEGVVAGDRRHWPGAASLLARILELRDESFQLPESPPADGPRRSDVIAQALRLGVLLRAHGVEGAPAQPVLDGLARTLAARVAADGSIPFRTDLPERQPNVWCAMFAEQALRWHGAPQAHACDPALLV